MQSTRDALANIKPYGLLIIFLLSLSAVYGVSITDSSQNFEISEQAETGNWTVYFNSSPGDLRAQKIMAPQSFSFSTLQHFDQETQTWVPQPADIGQQEITANWTDEYPYGRIVYTVEKFDRYAVNLTVSGESAVAENLGRPEQRESSLNLSSPQFLYELCAFTSGFDRCNPLQQGRSLPGTEPDRLRLDTKATRNVSLPSSSSIVNFSVDLSSVDDKQVADLSGNLLELGRIDSDADTDVVVAGGNGVRLYTDNLTSPTRLDFGSEITGLEIADAKPVEDGKQVFVSSNNGLFLANYSGQKKWGITGSSYSDVSSAQLSSNSKLYSSNDGEAEGFQCLGCADNSAAFTLPYSIEGQRNSYFLVAGLNFYNRSSDLVFEIDGTEYDLDESEISAPAEETAARDSGFDRAVAVGEQNFSTSSFVPDIRGEYLSLRLPVSKRAGASGTLTVGFNESRRELSPAQTISVATNTSVEVFDALSPVEQGGVARKIEFDLNDSQDTYVGLALNRDPGESKDLLLNTGQQTYEIDGERISETSTDVLLNDDLEADNSVQIRGQREAVATLDYDVSEINAQQLYIQSSLAFAGSKSGNLKLSVGGETYDVKESKIDSTSTLEFSVNDGSFENKSCIGCGKNSSKNDGNFPSFQLDDLGIPDSLPAQKATIEAPICYVGQKVDDLVLTDDSTGGLSGESYSVDVSTIPECGGEVNPTSVEVNASDLAPDYIRYVCGSCNQSAFFNLKADNSTNKGSRFFNRSTGSFELRPFDYAINVSSNSALTFTNVSTPVDASDVAKGENATYFCEGCDSSNYYRLLQDSSSDLPSYYRGGSGVEKLQDGFMTRLFTNTSLEHSFVYQRVEPQNIENQFINVSCPDCEEGYNLMRNSSVTGPSFRDGSSVVGDFGLKIEQRPTKFDLIDIPLNTSSVKQVFNLTFRCKGCAEESFFVGSGTSGSLSSSISADRTNTSFTGATTRFFTNTSLNFDKVRTQVEESDLQNGENVTFFCRGGCNGRSYGFPLDEDDDTPSYAVGTSSERLQGSLIVEVLALGSNPGREVIATKFPTVVEARSSSSASLWNYTLSSQPYDVSSGDINSQTGTEIQVATRSGVVTLNSTGSKIGSYPENPAWYRSVTTLNLSDHPGLETVGGTNDGDVVAFDATGTKIWETSLQSSSQAYVSTLVSGDITPEPGKEVAAGLDSGKVAVLNSSGVRIAQYHASTSILDLGQGNVSTTPGEELGLSADGIRFLPVQSAPTNLSIDIGDDGDTDTSRNGTFRGSQKFDSQDLGNSVSSLLEACSGRGERECRIPVTLNSSKPALVNLDNLSIYYRYNLSQLVDSQQVTKWSQTQNFNTGKQLNYRPLKISYETTEIPVRVGSLTSLALQREIESKREVKFNAKRFNTSGTPINLDGNRLQYFITTLESRTPDYIWYKNQTKEAPVVKEADSTGLNKTVTVRRNSSRTSVRFRNISVSEELDSKVVRQQFLEVDWNRDGEYTNITPSRFCGSLESETADGRRFFACRQDRDEDGVVDGFRWVHPYVGTSLSENNKTLYRVGGQPPKNRRPVVNSFNVSQRDFWGSVFNFSANLTEPEDELINTTLYIDVGSGFNAVGQKTNSTPVYEIESFKNWSSDSPVEVKLQYQDVFPSNLSAVNTPENTSVVNQPIERHDTKLEYVSGGSIEVDRKGEVWNTKFKAVDTVTGNRINSDIICGVKLFEEGEGNVLNLERPNATGFCDIETQGLGFSVGPHNWTGIVGGFQFYKDSESNRRNVTLIGNYTFNSSFNARTLFRPDDKPNSSLEYNITSIQGLFGSQREAPYEISLIAPSGDDLLLDEGSADGGNISGEFNLRDTEKLGERRVELLLTNSTQGSLSYFNDRRDNFSFTVLGVLNSSLNSPPSVLAEGDKTVNLTANVTNSLGSEVAPDVDFVTPKGICENIFTGERTFTCEFDPSNDLSAREYDWSINASKDFYRHEDTTATVEVSRSLEANLSLANNSVYRYNNSNRTSRLAYNLSEISDGSGPVDQVSYSVFWSGEQIKAGTTDRDGFNDSFDVPLSTPVGDTELKVELSKQGFQTTNVTGSATVFGTLNVSANNDATVFMNNSETRETDRDLATFLNVSVTDRKGAPVQDFDASFIKPQGTCSFSSSLPRYSCRFSPGAAADEGSRNWSAAVSKNLYQADTTSNREVLIKNLVRPEFKTNNPQVVRKESKNVTAQVSTPEGDTAASGFNITLEVGDQSTEQTLSSSEASIEYAPQCDVLPGTVDANATIEDLSRTYDVFEQTANGEVDVIEDVSSNITSPLDRSNPQARNYRRDETVDLSAQITDSCGSLNSSASFNVIWEAEDRDTSSIIANNQQSSWRIPDDFSGNTNVSVRVEGEYYENGTDQNKILIDRVINSRITGGLRPRTRKFGGDREFGFNATIITGNGLKAYKSSIEESWSEFNFTFFVEGDKLKEVSTDENGTATTNLSLSSDFDPGQKNIKARLENTSEINITIFDRNDSDRFRLIEETNLSISKPSDTNISFKESVNLSSFLSTPTDSKPSLEPNYTWTYQDSNDDPRQISSGPNSSFVAPSYVFGDGFINLSVSGQFLTPDTDAVATIGKRNVSIGSTEIPRFVQIDRKNLVNVTIDAEGISDLSGLSATYSLGGATRSNTSTSSGNIQIEVNGSNFDRGAYDSVLSLDDPDSRFLESVEPSSKPKKVVVPNYLNVSAYWRDNNENTPGSVNSDDEDGDNFPNLPNKTVYRNPGPFNEPDRLFLGANISTVFAETGETLPVDLANVSFYIQGTSAEGDQVSERIKSCPTNLTEFEAQQNDDRDTWFDDFTCDTSWNPRPGFPVGDYTLIINSTRPEQGWRAEQIQIPVEVRGVLNVSVTEPDPGQDDFQMNNLTLNADITDGNGNEFSDEDLEVYWSLDEDNCNSGGNRGTRNGGEVIDWDDAIAHGDRNSIFTWIIPGNPSNNGYNLDSDEEAWVDVEKEYFKVTRTESRPNFGDGCSDIGSRNDRAEVNHDLKAKVRTEVVAPSKSPVATDNNDILNVTADFFEFNTSQKLPNHFDGTFKAECLECTSGENDPNTNPELIRDDDAEGEDHEASFSFNFSDETYNENYTFRVNVTDTDNDYSTTPELKSDKVEVFVAKELDAGQGEGSVDINGKCEPSKGENVESAPSDCGFENLPERFHLNETVQSDDNQTQFNQFRNESSDIYKQGVKYYSEHPSYPTEGAGGCDFDGIENETYEDQDFCPDTFDLNSPPQVENSTTTKQYVKSSGTKLLVSAKVQDTDGNLNFVNATNTSSGNLVSFLTSASSSATTFTSFTSDPLTVSSDTSIRIFANDTQGASASGSELQIKEDPSNVSIESIDLEGRDVYRQEQDFQVSVELQNASTPKQQPSTVRNVTAEGNLLDYESSKGKYIGFVSADSEEEVDIVAREIAGYFDRASKTYVIDDRNPNVTNELVNATVVRPGAGLNLSATITDDFLDATKVNFPDGPTFCDNSTFSRVNEQTFACQKPAPSSTDTYTFEFFANDTAGNINQSRSAQVQVDGNPPSIPSFSTNGTIVRPGTTLRISAEVTDDEGNLNTTVIRDGSNTRCNNSEFSKNASGTFVCQETISEDTEFELKANDTVGNNATSTQSVIVDGTPPQIQLNEPAPQLLSGIVEVNASIEDSHLDVDSPAAKLEDGSSNLTERLTAAQTYFTAEIDTTQVADGTRNLYALAKDQAGNQNTTSVQLEIDNTPPDITINDPADGQTLNGEFQLNASVLDAENNLNASSVEYQLKQGGNIEQAYTDLTSSQDQDGFTDTINTGDFGSGSYTLKVRADDKADNQNTSSVSVDFDETPPSVDILEPANGSLQRQNFTLKTEVVDEFGTVEPNSIECRLGGLSFREMQVDSGDVYECEFNTTNLENDGLAGVFVRANDSFDQRATNFTEVNVDNTPPNINKISINRSLASTGTPIDVNVTIPGDDDSSLSFVEVDGHVNLTYDSSGLWRGVTEAGVGGDNFVNVTAVDRAGNTAQNNSVTYELDDQAPTVQIDTPSDGIDLNGKFFLNSTVSDQENNLNTSTVEYRVENSGNVKKQYTDFDRQSADQFKDTLNTSKFGSGTYDLKVNARDKAGNTNTTTVVVDFDEDPPSVDILEPANGSLQRQNFTLKTEIKDAFDNGDTSTYKCRLGGLSFREMQVDSGDVYECEFNTTNLENDGLAGVFVRANDSFDQRATNFTEVNVDNTAPDVSSVSANASIVSTGTPISVNVTIPGDDDSSLSFVEVDGHVNLTYDSSGLWRGVTEAGVGGDNFVNVTAVDRAGNTAQNNSLNYTIDDIRPDILNLKLNDTFISSGDTIKLEAKAKDNNTESLNATIINETSEVADNVTIINTQILDPDSDGRKEIIKKNLSFNGTDNAENNLSLSNGPYRFNLSSSDAAGNTRSLNSSQFIVDNEPPKINNPSLSDAIVQTNTNVVLDATITETNILSITINSEPVTTSSDVSETLKLNESTQKPIEIKVEDKSNNTAIEQLDFKLDDIKPSIQFLRTNITDGIMRSDDFLKLEADVNDPNLLSVQFNGTEAQDDNVGAFNLVFKPASRGCPDGVEGVKCFFQVNATDKAGNTNLSIESVEIDDRPPRAGNLTTNATTVQTAAAVEFSADASDPNLLNTTITNSTGKVCDLASVGGDTYNCTIQIGSTADYRLEAVDRAGNINDTSSIRIEADDTEPQINQFKSNATFNTSRSDRILNFSAQVTDTNLNAVRINSTNADVSNNLAQLTETPAGLGCPESRETTCTLQIKANDTAGNTQTQLITLKIDDIPPTVSSVRSDKSFLQSDAKIELSVNASGESNSSIRKVSAETGNLSWNGSVWNGSVEIDNDGFVNVTAIDFAQNTGSNNTITYKVDDNPPDISNLSSNATFNVSRSDTALNFTTGVRDENPLNVSLVNKSRPGNITMLQTPENNAFASTKPLSVGCPTNVNHQVCVVKSRSSDIVGNTNSTTYDLIIDDIKPLINNVSIEPSIVRPGGDTQVTVNVSGESDQQIRNVTAESELLSFDSGLFSGAVQIDNDGFVNVTANDYAPNRAENNTVEYTIDRNPPDISNLTSNSSDDVVRSTQTLNFTVSASDGVQVQEVEIEGQKANSGEDDNFFLVQKPSNLGCDEGIICRINATVFDEVERNTTTAYELKIDDTPPEVLGFEAINASEGNPDESVSSSILGWQANFTDFSNLSVELFATNSTSEAIAGNQTEMAKTSPGKFELVEKPGFFNATNGTFEFKAKATDLAGNTRNATYNLRIRPRPPEIANLTPSDPLPQEDRQKIRLTVNVSDTNAITSVNMTVNGTETAKDPDVELIEENTGNLTGGLFAANFTPRESGSFNVSILATDGTDLSTDKTFSRVFRAIGETQGKVTSAPSSLLFENVKVGNSPESLVNIKFNNTGLATAYGLSLPVTGVSQGIFTNGSTKQCGNIANGSGCSKTVRIEVTADSDTGTLSMVPSAAWTNPDESPGTASTVVTLQVPRNPILEEQGSKGSAEVDLGEPANVTKIQVFSAGNVELEDVKTEVPQTALGDKNLLSDDFRLYNENLDVPVNQTLNSTLQVNVSTKGSYGVELEANATGNKCSSECVDTRELDIDVFKRANVELLNSSGKVARDPALLEAKVTDEFQNPVGNYNVSFFDNETLINTSSTSNDGIASVTWNATQDPVGFHNLSVSISENRSRFYKTNKSLDSKTLELTDQLFLERNVSEREIFWYDTQNPHFTVFNYSLQDRNGFPVNTSVSLFTNATGTFERKGSCLTGLNGRCDILYNASVNGPVGALAVSNASKRFFNDTSDLEDFIEVVGGFSIAIESPQRGLRPALDTDVLRGDPQELEASVKNENGDSVDADVNWTLNNSKIGENKKFDWPVPSDLEYGFHTLTASTRNDQTITNDTVGVNVYDPAQLVVLNATKPQIRRNETFAVEAQVNNTRNNSPINDYTCRIFDGQSLHFTNQTDENGRCDLIFNASRERVGNHTITVDIPEVTADQFYLPIDSTNVFEVDIQEKLNITLLQPDNRINRYINISLNSTVRDRYGQTDADVRWTLDGRQISRGEDGYWLPRDETTVGKHNLTATASKQFFTSGNDTEKITVFGWADTDLQASGRLLRGQKLNITTRITDSNTSEPVANHPVDIFIRREDSQLQPAGNQTTGSAGFANLSLSTADRQPGLYEIQMKASDNSSTFYNVTDSFENQSVEILGDLNLSLDANQSLVYRNGFAEPQSVGLQLNTTDSEGGVNASFNLTAGEKAVGSGFTGEDGEFNLTYNPENISIGLTDITARASLDNYTQPKPAVSSLRVRTSIVPVWTNDEDASYNFSTKKGINVTANIDEEFTEKPITRYPFEALFGKRNDTYSAKFTEEWNNDGSGKLNVTDDTLFISNTTASRNLELDGKTRLQAKVENVTTNWSLGYRDGTWETPITETTNRSVTVSIDETPIEKINISSTGNLTVTALTLSDTTLEDKYVLGERKYLGYNTSTTRDNGQLDNSNVRNNLSACRSDPVCETAGWYAGDTPGADDSIEASRARGVFGSTGAELNITDLNPGASVRAKYLATPNTGLNLSNATHVAFWLDTNLTTSVNLNTESGCQISKQVDRHDGFSLRQIKIDGSTDGCGLLKNLSIEFENSGSFSESSVSKLDEVYVLEETTTGLNGSEILNWRPPSADTWSFKILPESKNFYNISSEFAFTDIQVLTGGGGDSATDSSTLESLKADATTFDIEQPEFNRTVASSTFGVVGSIQAENLLEEDPVKLNLTETTETGLLRKDSFRLAPSENRDLNIRYNSSSPGDFSIVGAIFNPNTRRSEEINITLRVKNVTMDIKSLKSENGLQNITPGDNIRAKANIEQDGTEVAQEVSWNSSIQGTPCSSTTSRYIGSGNWSVNCTAPRIPENPINTTLLLEASHDNLVIRDSRELKYRDVTPPFIVSSSTENVAKGENSSVSGTIDDNARVSNASARAVFLPNSSVVQAKASIDTTEFSFNFTETIYQGDYNVVVTASDANNNTANLTLPVSVNPPKNITGELDGVKARVELKRPKTGATLKESDTQQNALKVNGQQRNYDVEIEAETDPEGSAQTHALELQNANVTNQTDSFVNISDISVGNDTGFQHPPNTTNTTISGLAPELGVNFSSARIALNYSATGATLDKEPEENLAMFKCEFDNPQNCTAKDWKKLNSRINTTVDVVAANTSSASSFIVERLFRDNTENDTSENEGRNDQPADQQSDSASSGGGGGGGAGSNQNTNTQTTPNQQTAAAQEFSQQDSTSAADLSGPDISPMTLRSNLDNPVIRRGSSKAFSAEITNNGDTPQNVVINSSGNLSRYIEVLDNDIQVPAGESREVSLVGTVPENATTGSYGGSIEATFENGSRKIQENLFIPGGGTEFGEFDINLRALSDRVSPGQNLSYRLSLSSSSDSSTQANLTFFIREALNDEIVRKTTRKLILTDGNTVGGQFDTSKVEIGDYYVQARVSQNNASIVDADPFKVSDPFWTPLRVRAVLLLVAAVLISSGGWGAYQYIQKRREQQSRYVFPVDYDSLPEESDDNYWVGKIAESEKRAFIDPDDLTTHAIVSGSTGSGKSVTASVIAEEALQNDVPVVCFDPTAQWTGFVKELKDKDLLDEYERFGLDTDTDPQPYRGVIREIDGSNPDIDFKQLQNDGEITVFTLDQLSTEEFDEAVRSIIDQIFEEDWEESSELEMLVVFDEVHRLLEEYGGEGGYRALETGAREFRKWGIGLMMCSQVTADFKQAISGNIMTEIQLQTKSMEDIDRIETKYGEEFSKRISSEDIGTGMIQNSNYNDGDPWFVDFRPTYHNPHKIPDNEMQRYQKLSKEIDKVRQKVQKSDDTQDKSLEVQLAENKLKEGRFKMASMYVDSLKDELNVE